MTTLSGIITPSNVLTATNTQTLTNKTLTNPKVNGSSTVGGKVELLEASNNGTNFVALKAPDTLAADVTFTLPNADGTNGQVIQTNGSGALSFATPASATAADQTEMEAASSNSVFATPSNLKWHPGVAKAWLKCDASGNIEASYNIASISDDATGQVTATFTTAFSSTNYVMHWCSWGGNTMTYGKPTGQTTTTSSGVAYLSNTSGTAGDPFRWFFVAFGDQ